MDPKPTLSDLLALRDGELDDAELTAAIYADEQSRDELVKLARIRGELKSLPPVAPDPAVWEAIERRTRARPGWLQRFPLATAATVFLATALSVMLWTPGREPEPSAAGPQPVTRAADPVGQLMLRSRHLESELFTRAGGRSASEEALLYGIADVDARLGELYASEAEDPEARERLWRERVRLLESLAEVQRGQAVMRPAIY